MRSLPTQVHAFWDQVDQQARQLAQQGGWVHQPLMWPTDDPPWDQVHRLTWDLLEATGRAAEALMLTAPDLPTGERGQLLTLRRALWLQALSAWAEQTVPQPLLAPQGCLASVSLRVLLFDPRTGQGRVAQLTLHRYAAPGARLALVPAAGSLFTPCTQSFVDSLQAASACVRAWVPAEAAHGTALAWDLHAPGLDLWALDGPSAGAALGLAAAWLMRDQVTDPALRSDLMRLQPADLAALHLSAALHPGGRLGRVGHVREKAWALRDATAHLRQAPWVYLADEDEADAQVLKREGGAVSVDTAHDLRDLVHKAAQRALTLAAPQRELLQRLSDWDPLRADPPPLSSTADRRLLDQLTSTDPQLNPVEHLVQVALTRWAWWAHALRGQVHNRFVPLRVVADGARLPADLQLPDTPRHGLPQLLAEFEPDRLAAFLLRGSPGAGKSTLLQRHEQTLWHQALRQWQLSGQMDEIPLYLPLSGLQPQDEPMDWLRRQVDQRHPQADELRRLLDPGRRRPGDPRLRLLLDGLNELPFDDTCDTRERRAEAVLLALRQGLGTSLSLLLSVRTHHGFELRALGDVLAVDLQPWSEEEIGHYLARRFPVPQELAGQRLQQLKDQPHVLDLCSLPFNLDAQCQLWEAGVQRLASSRADLYRRLLWRMVVRELERQGSLLRRDLSLLSKADRRVLLQKQVLERATLPPWPRQGALLDGLFRQGLAQWARAAELRPDVPPPTRGEVELPWDDPADPQRSVAHWLHGQQTEHEDGPLRERWHQAVNELGLLDSFQPQPHTGAPDTCRLERSFKWRHQSWGEFLASVDLLAPTPAQMPPDALQALAHRLAAGRQFERRDEDEVAHLQAQVSQRWNLSPFRPGSRLHREGICVPQAVLEGFLRQQWGWQDQDFTDRAGRPFHEQGGFVQLRRNGAFVPETDATHGPLWRAMPEEFGFSYGVAQAIGLPGEADWTERPEGWQRLVIDVLWPPLCEQLWRDLVDKDGLSTEQCQALQDEPGHLAEPGPADLDEVLALALDGLPPDQTPDQGEAPLKAWLGWLLHQGLWRALGPALPGLARRLEPDGAWGPAVDARLQHLRRVLLLTSLDAGPDSRAGVAAGGTLALIDADTAPPAPPGQAGGGRGLLPELAAAWQQAWQAAFSAPGQDLRLRLQAAHWLGRHLGDNLRYQRAAATGGAPGLRLHPRLWCRRGGPGQRFGIGASPQDDQALPGEHEAWVWAADQPFELATLPVTVAEWACFVAAGGYDLPPGPWWHTAGPAAVQWLQDHPGHPPALRDPAYNALLQPMVAITAFEAQAYVAWAAPMVAAADGLALAVPSEAQWEAGVRGPLPPGPWRAAAQPRWTHLGNGEPGPLHFNHARSRWGRPSPVGVFSLSTTADGVADAQGNVAEWCSNVHAGPYGPAPAGGTGPATAAQQAACAAWSGDLEAAESMQLRALRGGAFSSAAAQCRASYRSRYPPDDRVNGSGVRLVRVWPPHSEP
ncbi:SUMF1/EgtB/PvdO family nonheme iron enzyme [Ideonella sp. 4Y16]|uniref:SUMF1/EgtB/PvdO family nonheme iron enzyme n=1 Tax=Ideonella alba TaxID=2824118 RepID=UPI001B39AE79|nr:SUMF1/EgtB/PvdO family nonheme iron enzyme [Ideonella alba]MBQ0942270.1 SUMF1/EgtB/PvdO family nonheme iron enzyme [Ideonella alba]